MSHILQIMAGNDGARLEKIAAASDSLLTRAAAALCSDGLMKVADGGETGLKFPDNPVLVSLKAKLSETPAPDAPEIQQLLLRVLTLDLQNMMAKFERDKVMSPMEMEADRIQGMANILRARVEVLRKMKEFKELQAEMAEAMGLMPNAAVAAAGQMPTGAAPQPPPVQGPPPGAAAPGPAGPPAPAPGPAPAPPRLAPPPQGGPAPAPGAGPVPGPPRPM